MPSSLILTQELQSAAHRWSTFRQRIILAIGMLFALGSLYITVYFPKPGILTTREMAWFAEYVFGLAALTQILLTIWLVPTCVAGAIAEEKERRRLPYLLTTQLTSAEIVLGKLAAGLTQYASCLATGLPILIVLPLFGGVDPRWILLTYAGTCSTAYFLAGLSILISTAARSAASAVGAALALASVWCSLPVLIQLLPPRALPRLWPWISSLNEWLLASAPSGAILAAMGAGPGWRFVDSIIWMIGLQLSVGSALIAWAVARFRGACRDEEKTEAVSRRPRRPWLLIGKRPLDRPPFVDNPVLWKELYTARPRGIAAAVGLLVAIGLILLIGYGTYVFARPAFEERFASGFGRATTEVHRAEFNQFLRSVTSCVEFLILLIVAGAAAGGVTAERSRETWDSLIATPLSGRAILRAKGIGAVWKVRWGVFLLIVLWSVGLFIGSLHPVGFVAALVLLGVSIGFMTALGTYQSLVSRNTPQASSRTFVPALLLMCSFVACYLPPRIASVLIGCGSPPFVTFLSLASYADIDEVVRGEETFGRLELIGIYTYESPLRVLATCLLGTAGFAAGAIWLSRAAVSRFDRAVGRAERAMKPREELVALASFRNRRVFRRARQHRTGSQSPDRDAVTTGREVLVVCATGSANAPTFRGRSWWRKGRVVLCVSALMIPGIAYIIPSWREHRLLHDALAETDRLYPGWHIEDLEAARRRVPDATNGALRVLGAASALPARWHCEGEKPSDAEQKRRNAVAMLAPTQCLAPRTLQSLQTDFNEAGSALTEARTLKDFSGGRFVVAWASDGVSTQLRHLAMSRDVVSLLAYDVLLRSQKQETDEALLTCRALLNVGRSIGDEPTAVSQRLRIDIRMTTCQQVEFALAHGRASEAVLATLQHALDVEEDEPLLVWGIKGERALMDRLLTSVESGEFTPKQVRNTTFFSTILHLFRNATAVRAAHLRFSNSAEGFSTLPAVEQLAAYQRLDGGVTDLPPDVQDIVPAMRRLASAFQNSRARLKCASVAVAAERYRLARNTWPSTLESLMADFLAKVPTDPFGGELLRLRRFADRIVIYSVAEDGRDDGGDTDSTSLGVTGRDLGFRLWDPVRRHQPTPDP